MNSVKLKSVILFKHIRLADNEQVDRLDINSKETRRKVEEIYLVPNVGIIGFRKHKVTGEIFQFILGTMLIQSCIPFENIDVKDKPCQCVKIAKKGSNIKTKK